MSGAIPYGRALAAAAGAAQGQQQNIARMFGVWQAPTHQGDDRRAEEQRRAGEGYLNRLRAKAQAEERIAQDKRDFEQAKELERMREGARQPVSTAEDRLKEFEAKKAIEAKYRAPAAAKREPSIFDRMQEKMVDEQAKTVGEKMRQVLGVSQSPAEKDAAKAAASDDKRAVAERKRLLTPAGQAQTSAELRSKAESANLPGLYGMLAKNVVSPPEFEKMKATYQAGQRASMHEDRADARQDKSIAATDARQEKALGARASAADEKVIERHDARMASLGAQAARAAQKEYEEATDQYNIMSDLKAPKEGETPEQFEARREAFRKEAEARNFRALSRETMLTSGLDAIANMDPSKASEYLGTLVRLASEGRLSKEDFNTLFLAVQKRVGGTRQGVDYWTKADEK